MTSKPERTPHSAHLRRHIHLNRNHVPLPAWNRFETRRRSLHLYVVLLFIDRNHSPSLSMKNKLDPCHASPSNKVLVKCPDAALAEEIEHSILLDVRYD